MKKAFLIAPALLLASGCVLMQPKQVQHHISAPFDEEKAESLISEGDAEVMGTAFLRQKGGGVVTCAGSDVRLHPVTEYATERLDKIYGRAPSVGEVSFADINTLMTTQHEFSPDEDKYHELSKIEKCDAQGEFSFSNIKEGEFYVITKVYWEVSAPQGGFLATRVKSSPSPQKTVMTK